MNEIIFFVSLPLSGAVTGAPRTRSPNRTARFFKLIALGAALCASLPGGVSITSTDATRQQGIVSFSVPDPTQCTITVYSDFLLTAKIDDTNNALFAGSESCNRAGNIVNGGRVTAVVGLRGSGLALDGKLHSRSLQVVTQYWLRVTDLVNNVSSTSSFTTVNIPWGDTHTEEAPYHPAGFNHWGYPTLDWSAAGQSSSYNDPISGVRVTRAVRQMFGGGGPWGDLPGYEFAFTDALDLNGVWTNPGNVKSTSAAGPFASYASSSRGPLWIPLPPSPHLTAWNVNGDTPEDLQLNLYGSASDTGTPDDRKLLVCLAVNFNPTLNTCSSEIEVTLPTVSGEIKVSPSYPAFQLAGWNVGRYLSSEEFSVPSGNATVMNSAVTLTSGYLPMTVASGMKITINGSWYTVATLQTATTFTLMEPGITANGSWYLGTLGFRIRKKTTSTNAINLAATYSLAYGYNPAQGSGCNRNTFPVGYAADGVTVLSPPKTGRLCMLPGVLMLVTDDGETRYLSNLDHQVLGVRPTIPLGAFHVSDPYSLWAMGADDSVPNLNHVFYKVTYDYANPACRFKQWNGNGYLRRHDGDVCMIWNNLNPTAGGNTIAQQLDPIALASPIWDTMQLGASSNFVIGGGGMSGNYAMLYRNTQGQNSVTFYAVFDLTTGLLVKMFDSFSGSLPGLRWGGSHSNGIEIGSGTKFATIAQAILPRDLTGWMAGPFFLPPVIAKSFDGVTWNTDTGLTNGCPIPKPSVACGDQPVNIPAGVWNLGEGIVVNNDGTKCVGLTWVNDGRGGANCATTLSPNNPNTVAGVCGPNPYGVTGQRCVWVKVSSDRPCNATATAHEATRWPCPWTSGTMGGPGWSSPQTLEAGDSFAPDPNNGSPLDGKRESMRVLTKTFDGTNWVLMMERWTRNDNITSDPNQDPPAVAYYDHLFSGLAGNIHPNGWRPWMQPSGGSVWMDLSLPASATVWKSDSIQPHFSIGQGPTDPATVTQVGSSGSRTGVLPGIAGTHLQHTLNIHASTFAGVVRPSGEANVEQYPSIFNWSSPTVASRSLYWDWRHINPSWGAAQEIPQKMWNHTYNLVGGQNNTYLMDIHDDIGNHKERRPNVFSTRSAFYDISSPATGNVIDDSKPFAYCYVYKANECRTGSSAGQLYVVAPNANIGWGGCVSNTQKFYTPCATPLWHFAGWMVEGSTQDDDLTGAHIRRITMGFSGPTAQYEYTSPQMLADSSAALVRPTYAEGVRPDMLLVKLPPPATADSLDRSGYIPVLVPAPPGSGYLRARFGYAENGPATSFFCTSRQEACVTVAAIAPFAFAQTDTLTAANCASGCTLSIPALSGRVLYYRVEWSPNGSSGWTPVMSAA